MKNLCILALILLLAGLAAAPASAFSYGTNITIDDGNASSGTWYGTGEDQEVEPGMVGSQAWDLEGFFLDSDNVLSLVGGFDFVDGVAGNEAFSSGDIFISTINSEGDSPIYGNIDGVDGNTSITNSYGYDYVLDLDFETFTYTVYQLDSSSVLQTAYYEQNEGSSPWQYNDDDNSDDIALLTGSFSFSEDVLTDFVGDDHYLLTGFDLSFLGHDTEFYSHFTMGCGNDNLMGHGVVVPEPGTWLLFGAGLVALALVRRRNG
nr:PEP-CTERM sorting domain-containing protein [uncultured Desulfuromonas sp.]